MFQTQGCNSFSDHNGRIDLNHEPASISFNWLPSTSLWDADCGGKMIVTDLMLFFPKVCIINNFRQGLVAVILFVYSHLLGYVCFVLFLLHLCFFSSNWTNKLIINLLIIFHKDNKGLLKWSVKTFLSSFLSLCQPVLPVPSRWGQIHTLAAVFNSLYCCNWNAFKFSNAFATLILAVSLYKNKKQHRQMKVTIYLLTASRRKLAVLTW